MQAFQGGPSTAYVGMGNPSNPQQQQQQQQHPMANTNQRARSNSNYAASFRPQSPEDYRSMQTDSHIHLQQQQRQRSLSLNASSSSHLRETVHAGVQIFEIIVNGISVMRRQSDGCMNANQILKAAGIDGSRRSQILERDFGRSASPSVGGNGRYKGIWIPCSRARQLAEQLNISHPLRPLFDLNALSEDGNSTRNLRKRDSQSDAGIPHPAKKQKLDDNRLRLRPSTSHPAQQSSLADDPMRLEKHRQALFALFTPNGMAQSDLSTESSSPHLPPDLNPDTILDEHLHTALHWAATLGRRDVCQMLLDRGADMYRGNISGETPLMRAVLASNSHEADVFPLLLDALSPTLRTIDRNHRSVLHHIAQTAGSKARAGAARYHLECVLEHIVRREDADLAELIDASDIDGDTALNIAARLGALSLVKLLQEAGADESIANKHGLKPADFGYGSGSSLSQPGASSANGLSSSGSQSRSGESLRTIFTLVESLRADFAKEIGAKDEALEAVHSQLREATQQLVETRKSLSDGRRRSLNASMSAQRIINLERVIAQEEMGLPSTTQTNADGEILLPSGSSPDTLVKLRLTLLYLQRSCQQLRQRLDHVKGSGIEQESRYRRVVAMSCGIEVEKVDDMLEQLLVAIEADGGNLDVARVHAFMAKNNQM